MSDKRHTQHAQSLGADLIQRLHYLDAAALAAPAGMNLGLDHPHGAAELLRRPHRFLDRKGRDAARDCGAKTLQDFLRLILMNIPPQPFLLTRDPARSSW